MATVTDGEREKIKEDKNCMIFKFFKAKETATVIDGHLCPPKHLYTSKYNHSSTIEIAQIYKQFKCQ